MLYQNYETYITFFTPHHDEQIKADIYLQKAGPAICS